MALTEVHLPQTNVNDTTARVVEWHIEDGIQVTEGDLVVTVETSKAAEEIEAPVSGIVRHGVKLNDDVPVGAVVFWLADDTEEFSNLDADAESSQSSVNATKKARALALELGFDLNTIDAPGVITEKHVRAAAGSAQTDRGSATAPTVAPDESLFAETVPLTRVQKSGMKAVQRSQQEAAATFMTGDADVTGLVADLERLAEGGTSVSILDVLIGEVGTLLQDFPRLNATLVDDAVKIYAARNVAVTTDVDGDLHVVTVPDADTKSLLDVAAARLRVTADLFAGKARERDLAAGTFTVTVLEHRSLVHQIPVIFPGQAGIVGLGGIRDEFRPGEDSAPERRKVVGVSLSYDHRFVNGAYAADFLQALVDRLESGIDLGAVQGSTSNVTATASALDAAKNLIAPILKCQPSALPDGARINKVDHWDSLAQVQITIALEKFLGGAIDPVEGLRLNSLAAFAAFIDNPKVLDGATATRFDGDAATLRKEISTGLGQIGITAGDVVIVHSYLGSVLHIDGATDAVIGAFEDVLGPDGTLVMPAFTNDFTRDGKMDRRLSPTDTGILTDEFLADPTTHVSPHPFHRFVSRGKHAAALSAMHSPCSFGPDSPLGQMHEMNGKIVTISIDWGPVTFFHYVEEALRVPYRTMKSFEGSITDGDVTTEETWDMYVRPMDGSIEHAFAAAGDRLRAAGMIKRTTAAGLVLEAGEMKPIFDFAKAELMEDPYRLVTRTK